MAQTRALGAPGMGWYWECPVEVLKESLGGLRYRCPPTDPFPHTGPGEEGAGGGSGSGLSPAAPG